MNYSKLWTQFETQSLAFGLLRKALYPSYLVRGEYGQIKIYRPTADRNAPVELIVLNVHASTSKEEDRFEKTSDNTYLVVGGKSAMNIVMHVVPELKARAEGA